MSRPEPITRYRDGWLGTAHALFSTRRSHQNARNRAREWIFNTFEPKVYEETPYLRQETSFDKYLMEQYAEAYLKEPEAFRYSPQQLEQALTQLIQAVNREAIYTEDELAAALMLRHENGKTVQLSQMFRHVSKDIGAYTQTHTEPFVQRMAESVETLATATSMYEASVNFLEARPATSSRSSHGR